MVNKCNKIQDKLLDIFYSEGKMSKEIKKHLETCKECKKYYEKLSTITNDFDILKQEIKVDYNLIAGAFIEAERIQDKRKSRVDLVIFIIIAVCLVSMMLFIMTTNFISYLIIFQIIMVVCAPILVLIILKYRLVKEGYDA